METLIKKIKAKAYQGEYLIYCRKSTDDSENQKNSLGHQKRENVAFAKTYGLQIAQVTQEGFCTNGVISESHSGFKEDSDLTFTDNGSVQYKINRPKFNQLVQYLNEGYFAGIICMSWDRLSRNKTDNSIITKLIRRGVDVKFVTATYDDTSAGALHMDIDGMFAQHHSRVTREKVTNAMHKMRDDGIVVYIAPLGYLNTGAKYQDVGSTQHKPFDPVRAPIVKEIFEKYATGEWSMPDLAKWANEQGLKNFAKRRPRTKAEVLSENSVIIEKVEKPIVPNNIYYILGNKFYLGLMLNSRNQWIPSLSHEPLIDQDLFDKVQKMRNKKQVSIRYKKAIGHALRGFVRCTDCGRVYTPYMKKGIQYFSSRCIDGCQNGRKSCNLAFIEKELGQYMQHLFLEPHELDELDQKADTGIAVLEVKMQKEREQSERSQRKINEDLAYLRANRLNLLKSGVYTPDAYIGEEQRLLADLNGVQEKETITQEAMHQTIKDAMRLSELLNNLAMYYEEATSPEKEEIIRCIFSELSLNDKVLSYQLKNEFRALKKDSTLFSALTRNRTWIAGTANLHSIH